MSIFDEWETDEDAEQRGVIEHWSEEDWLQLARAGGSNKQFMRRINALYTKYRRQLDGGINVDAVLEPQLVKIYTDTIVMDGELRDKPKEKGGRFFDEEGNGKLVALKGNRDAIHYFLSSLPEFFKDVRARSGGIDAFRLIDREEEAKN